MFYAGEGKGGPVFLPRESHFLVLGPPRSGKTRSIVVPNILASPGPVIATSTKNDLIETTFAGRSRVGRVMVFDPSGNVPTPEGVVRVYWSPINPRGDFSATESSLGPRREGGRCGPRAVCLWRNINCVSTVGLVQSG